ncbi:MAG: tail fiber domain-containing protein [Alphaproteobacteria bacterium]
MKTSPHRILATVLIFFSLVAVGHEAQAIVPTPDGCYPGYTTAEGCNALNFLTSGLGNTGVGWYSLFSNSSGSFNTGVGGGTLVLNNGDSNTALGAAALLLNTAGTQNTAVGTDSLVFNDSGGHNTATGAFALFDNTTGSFNAAHGDTALQSNTTGFFNTAVGSGALNLSTETDDNTAVGAGAMGTSIGANNTAIGRQAGLSSGAGNNNVYLGSDMVGVAGENDHTYIRNINTTSVSGAGTDTVTVNLTTGLIGHLTSSRRYKEDIKPMDNSSQMLFALKPVTFRYKKEIDQSQSLDYGLIAEQVAQIDPNLAIRNKNGEIESVRYSAINAMLLNEFLKEHKAFLEEKRKVQRLEAALDTVNQRLKEQEAKISKVSAQVEESRPALQVVTNN